MLNVEREIAGRFILKEDEQPLIAERVKPEYFLDSSLKKLMAEGIRQFSDTGKINPYSLDRTIGRNLVPELINSVCLLGEIGGLVEELSEKHRRRQLKVLGENLPQWLDGGEPSDVIRGRIEAEMGKLSDGKDAELKMTDVASAVINDAIAVREGKQEIGIPTPWKSLNETIGGLKPATMVLVSGSTSVGKSQFMIELAYHTSLLAKRVLFFSLEMTAGQIFTRLAARHTGINTRDIEVGKFSEKEGRKIEELGCLLDETGFRIIDDFRNVEKIRWLARAEDARKKTGLVVVDYIQRVRDRGSPYERVSEASQVLFDLSREVSASVVVASQISQESVKAEKRGEMVGTPSGKHSGETDEIPDVRIHLVREEDRMSVTISKNRFGWLREFAIRFTDNWTRLTQEVSKNNGRVL